MASVRQENIQVNVEVNGKRAGATISELERNLRAVRRELNQLPPGSEEFVKKSEEFKKINDELKSIKGEAFGVKSALSQLTPLAGALSAAFVASKVVGFFKDSSAAAKEFEVSMSQLKSLTGATAEELEFYAEQAADIGATTTLSASQAVEAFTLMGGAMPKLMESKEGLAAVTREAVTLSEAAGITLPEAAQALSSVMNQFNMEGEEANRIINALAAGSQAGAAEIPDLTAAVDKAGLTAKNFNVSLEESVGMVEVLSTANLKGAEAGTALRNVLLTMSTVKALPEKAQKELQRFGVDLDVVSDKTIPVADRMRELSKIAGDSTAMFRVFGKENINAGATLLQNIDVFEEMTEAVTGTNTAVEQAAINTDNLQGDLAGLSSIIESIQIGIGTHLNKAVRAIVQSLTAFLFIVRETPKFLKENKDLFIALGIALVTFNTATIASTASTIANIAAEKGRAIALQASAVAQRLLNAAMTANPIGLVVKAIGLLVGAFVVWYNRSEQVRASIAGLFAAAVQVFENLKNAALQYLGGVGDILVGIFTLDVDKIKSGFSSAFEGVKDLYTGAGEGVADAYNKGYDDKIESERQARLAKEAEAQEESKDQAIAALELQMEEELEVQSEGNENLKKAREKYHQDMLAASKAIEDLRVSLIEDSFDREIAKLELETSRKIAALVGTPEQIAEQQALLEEQLIRGTEEIEAKRAEAEKAARQRTFDERMEEEAEREEMEMLMIEERFLLALETEQERQDAMYELELAALERRAEMIRQFHGEDSIEYARATNEILRLNKERNDQLLENERRTQELKAAIESAGFDTSKSFLKMGIDLMGQDEEARKKNANKIKAFQMGEISISLIKEVQSIWAGAAQLGPIAGPIMGAIQTGIAIARGALAIGKVSSQKFRLGGWLRGARYALGGIVRGPKHEAGGIPFFNPSSGTIDEMEGDEIILTSGVSRDPRLRAVASMINVAAGGRMFEAGGPINPYRAAADAVLTGGSTPEAMQQGQQQEATNQSNQELLAEVRGLRGDVQNLNTRFKAYIVYSELEDAQSEVAAVRDDASIQA